MTEPEPITEVRYRVPNSGHGYTLDRPQAVRWAKRAAKLGASAEIQRCEVTITPWVTVRTIEPAAD